MKKSAKIIAAATLSSMLLTGCNTTEPDFKEPTPTTTVDPADTNDTDNNVMGIVPAIEGEFPSFVTVDPPEIEEEPILMGDVPYVPEEE